MRSTWRSQRACPELIRLDACSVSEGERNQAKRGSRAVAPTGGHAGGLSRPSLPWLPYLSGRLWNDHTLVGELLSSSAAPRSGVTAGRLCASLAAREGGCPGRTRLGLHLARGVGLFPVTVSPKMLPCRVTPTSLASNRLNRVI